MVWRRAKPRGVSEVVVYTDSDALGRELLSGFGSYNIAAATRPLAAMAKLDGEVDLPRIGTVLVDLRDGKAERELRTLRSHSVAGKRRIVGLGDDDTLEFYRHATRAGCDEYFALERELSMLIDYVAGNDETSQSANIVVHGVKPGIGASLISAGLAQYLSDDADVDIVDMTWSHPTTSYWLGLDRTGDIHKLVGMGERIDKTITDQVALRVNDAIRYFGGYDMGGGSRFDLNDAAAFYLMLGGGGTVKIWKTDRENREFTSHVLRHADHMVLVSDRSLPSLRGVNDMLGLNRKSGQTPVVVVNDPYVESDMNTAKFRSLIDGRGTVFVPRLRRLKAQLLDGIVPGGRRSRLRRHIRKIAIAINPRFGSTRRRRSGR